MFLQRELVPFANKDQEIHHIFRFSVSDAMTVVIGYKQIKYKLSIQRHLSCILDHKLLIVKKDVITQKRKPVLSKQRRSMKAHTVVLSKNSQDMIFPCLHI